MDYLNTVMTIPKWITVTYKIIYIPKQISSADKHYIIITWSLFMHKSNFSPIFHLLGDSHSFDTLGAGWRAILTLHLLPQTNATCALNFHMVRANSPSIACRICRTDSRDFRYDNPILFLLIFNWKLER